MLLFEKQQTQLEELTNGLDRQCLVGRFGVYISRTLKAIALHQQNLAERVKACCDTYIDLFFDYDFQEVLVCTPNKGEPPNSATDTFVHQSAGGKMECEPPPIIITAFASFLLSPIHRN